MRCVRLRAVEQRLGRRFAHLRAVPTLADRTRCERRPGAAGPARHRAHLSGHCDLPSCQSWSDVPQWDAIAALRENEVLGDDPAALAKARAAFAYVENGSAFALGACPDVRYQQPAGGSTDLKTLETDSNAVKAAILLYEATGEASYLDSAVSRYAAIRARFLSPDTPLYTVYVIDDGHTCTQLPHRFFASVNGNMIWSGLELSRSRAPSST